MTQERQVEELLDAAPVGFVSFGDDGTIVLINTTLLQMLGYERAALVGKSIENILSIGSRIFYQTHWFPLLRMHGSAEEIFLMLRTHSAGDIGVLANAVRREDSGGAVTDCAIMRVRERQKYEDELLRARRAAEEAAAALAVTHQEVLDANERLEEQAIELELQHQQLEDQAARLEEAGRKLRSLNSDLIERSAEAERLQHVAEEANRAKSTFIATMSHELRTPLNAIAGYTALIEMGIHGPVTEPQREALHRIEQSQRHLLRLINDVLNLARVEAGHISYTLADLSVARLIETVTPMIEPQASAKRVQFAATVSPEMVVHADAEKLEQILLNLLSNAIKFTPSGGSITVEAQRATHDEVVILVSDTGIGIPADKLENVFEPFVQVQTGDGQHQEGTGLGLAISRDLARGMGGDLTAQSTLGSGSIFTLSLRASHQMG